MVSRVDISIFVEYFSQNHLQSSEIVPYPLPDIIVSKSKEICDILQRNTFLIISGYTIDHAILNDAYKMSHLFFQQSIDLKRQHYRYSSLEKGY